MNIVFTYNVKNAAPSLTDEEADKCAEFDSPETIKGIADAIKANGHKVILVEADEKAHEKFNALKKKKAVDLVFNIAEGFGGEARESHIPCMLESFEIPYTGSGPLALAITLDKAKTKEILSYHGIPNARFQVFHTEKDKLNKKLRFPLIAKPNAEGSSKGIRNDCFVKNEMQLRKKVSELLEKYKQPVLVEEFLQGREFTVGMIGNFDTNQKPKVLPIVEITFEHLPKGINRFDSYEAKWIYDNPDSKFDPLICPAKLPKKLEQNIKQVCIDASRALGLKDWCRIDLRLDSKGIPNIIEINALPGIIPDPKENSRLPRAARVAGMSYEELIGTIINSASERYCLNRRTAR